MKKVTKEEFIKFIKAYPNKLEQDQYPEYMHSWNDFSEGKKWPESMVATVTTHRDDTEEYSILE